MELATRRYMLFLSHLLLWYNQDILEDHGDCQDQRLGANQVQKNRGCSGCSVIHKTPFGELYLFQHGPSYISSIGPVLGWH